MFGKTNFKACPHYKKPNKVITRLESLEKGHQIMVGTLKEIAAENKQGHDNFKAHMEKNANHHRETNEALIEMNSGLATLIVDKQNRDKRKDKRENWRDLLVGGVVLAFILAVSEFLFNQWATLKVLGVSG